MNVQKMPMTTINFRQLKTVLGLLMLLNLKNQECKYSRHTSMILGMIPGCFLRKIQDGTIFPYSRPQCPPLLSTALLTPGDHLSFLRLRIMPLGIWF